MLIARAKLYLSCGQPTMHKVSAQELEKVYAKHL